ncbi:MAG: sulfite exporter TauE/SafE family protein, partial [Betaproteobacteria bacterium]|nr:sulfite exporter TauE/SafE family protein [Betaproteobacteria bacterium]
MELVWITLASGLAGFVDSIVGGGGLILLPALLVAYPSAPAAAMLGTNKSASVWGTAFASWQFCRRIEMPWRIWLPAAGLSFSGSLIGAWGLTLVSSTVLKQLL